MRLRQLIKDKFNSNSLFLLQWCDGGRDIAKIRMLPLKEVPVSVENDNKSSRLLSRFIQIIIRSFINCLVLLQLHGSIIGFPRCVGHFSNPLRLPLLTKSIGFSASQRFSCGSRGGLEKEILDASIGSRRDILKIVGASSFLFASIATTMWSYKVLTMIVKSKNIHYYGDNCWGHK
jgi:hypothetical protein